MTRTEVLEVLATLSIGLPNAPEGKQRKDAMAMLWLDLFADVPAGRVRPAIRAYLLDTTPKKDGSVVGEWWPAPAQIRAQMERLDEPRYIGEWDRVVKAISRGEVLLHITPQIRAGIEAAGGASAIKGRLEKDTPTMRAAFIDGYRKSEAATQQQLTNTQEGTP